MAKLNSYKRIISGDYPQEDQKLVEQLGVPLNSALSDLFYALSNRLTFEDNFFSTVKSVDVIADANGNPTTRTSIALTSTSPVRGVLVIAAVNATSPTSYATGTPFVSFTQNGQALYIDNITGLVPNNRYNITLIALN